MCLAATLGLAAAALAAEPLAVFVTPAQVTERKKVDDATKKDLKAKKEAARDARKALKVKRNLVTLAASAAEADIVLQIEGRRGEKTLPTPETPAFLFESNNGGGTELGCFSTAADQAAKTLEKMIAENKGLSGS